MGASGLLLDGAAVPPASRSPRSGQRRVLCTCPCFCIGCPHGSVRRDRCPDGSSSGRVRVPPKDWGCRSPDAVVALPWPLAPGPWPLAGPFCPQGGIWGRNITREPLFIDCAPAAGQERQETAVVTAQVPSLSPPSSHVTAPSQHLLKSGSGPARPRTCWAHRAWRWHCCSVGAQVTTPRVTGCTSFTTRILHDSPSPHRPVTTHHGQTRPRGPDSRLPWGHRSVCPAPDRQQPCPLSHAAAPAPRPPADSTVPGPGTAGGGLSAGRAWGTLRCPPGGPGLPAFASGHLRVQNLRPEQVEPRRQLRRREMGGRQLQREDLTDRASARGRLGDTWVAPGAAPVGLPTFASVTWCCCSCHSWPGRYNRRTGGS